MAPSRLTAADRKDFLDGRHYRLWEKMGAHPERRKGQTGYSFRVWAPNAREVSVVGAFNAWDKSAHPLEEFPESGIWEAFVPGVEAGQAYKFHVVSKMPGLAGDKADPFAFRAEVPPARASLTARLDYEWSDADWMRERAERQALDRPISIYELHLGSWRLAEAPADRPAEERFLTYEEIADPLIEHLREHGFSHVELLPVMEHPFYGSWGYQVTGFFAATSRYGSPQGLMRLIDRLHQAGFGVLLDWVPSHFPTDGHGLAFFDGTHLFEHADPRRGFHPDWKTYIFNYERPQVCSFLGSSAHFWLEVFHADGLRVDAVASMLYRDYSRKPGQWVPNAKGGRENLEAVAFLRRLNDSIHEAFPGALMVAEESTAWPGVTRSTRVGGLGFDLKWDLGWMNDTLKYHGLDPIARKYEHQLLTFRPMYAGSERFVVPLSHDEVVHGKRSLLDKMPGKAPWKYAQLRALLGWMWASPGKKLLFMGDEIGQWREWAFQRELDWDLLEDPHHRGISRWVRDLNALYRDHPVLARGDYDPKGFEWVDCRDADQSVVSLLRRDASGEEALLFVFNFTPVDRYPYRIGVPWLGFWKELLCSDAEAYGGPGGGNLGGMEAQPVERHGRPASLPLSIPGFSASVFLAPERPPEAVSEAESAPSPTPEPAPDPPS